ncbi:MAG: PfkB family carbohydrate kinase [Caulobacter sp.]|nr:PfkB family carbohydrate kinase [Caulobacter sp.]
MSAPLITVVGSVNLDFVATARTLPAPGETVTGATLARHPGGKGANQALAARRLGAAVRLIGRVGADGMADEALALLKAEGVDLSGVAIDRAAPTGVALIGVDAEGENQIIVAPGANAAFTSDLLPTVIEGALICQMELPAATVAAAVARATGFVCVNLAPALDVPDSVLRRADLIVVNQGESEVYGRRLHGLPGLVAVTWGSRGAGLFHDGARLATAEPPEVSVIDSTGAGDTFVAALTVALLEGMGHPEALAFACAAGALTATRAGAQPSLPTRAEVEGML